MIMTQSKVIQIIILQKFTWSNIKIVNNLIASSENLIPDNLRSTNSIFGGKLTRVRVISLVEHERNRKINSLWTASKIWCKILSIQQKFIQKNVYVRYKMYVFHEYKIISGLHLFREIVFYTLINTYMPFQGPG